MEGCIAIGWSLDDIKSGGLVVMPRGRPFAILQADEHMVLYLDRKQVKRFTNKERIIWHDPTQRLSKAGD